MFSSASKFITGEESYTVDDISLGLGDSPCAQAVAIDPHFTFDVVRIFIAFWS